MRPGYLIFPMCVFRYSFSCVFLLVPVYMSRCVNRSARCDNIMCIHICVSLCVCAYEVGKGMLLLVCVCVRHVTIYVFLCIFARAASVCVFLSVCLCA